MRRYIIALALSGASAFLAPPAPAAARTIVFKKKDKDAAEDAEPVQVNAMSKGTVVEFDLNKHTTLGVIDGHKVKAKGGLRYEIKTSDGKLHAGIAPRDIHFSAPGAKNNLDEMLQVLDTEAPALVDPEVLEICYEVAAEEEKELGLQQIASLLDAGSGPVDIYRTFRVLSCELGKVFFQKAKGHTKHFNARAKKTVEAAKRSLCGQHGDEYGEFCLV